MYPKLGVNVDHVATIRQQRDTRYPDPVAAASIAELAGADQITVHLREDRRHIQDRDVEILRRTVQTRLNLEMASTDEMVGIALQVRPDMVTLVPEKREERTTEGGLDVARLTDELRPHVTQLVEAGIVVSMFIEADNAQIDASAALGATMVELHTGEYAEASGTEQQGHLRRIADAARYGDGRGVVVAAGHGLDYKNVQALALIPEIVEYNIGHSLVARAVLVGFDRAVREMIDAIREGTHARSLER